MIPTSIFFFFPGTRRVNVGTIRGRQHTGPGARRLAGGLRDGSTCYSAQAVLAPIARPASATAHRA